MTSLPYALRLSRPPTSSSLSANSGPVETIPEITQPGADVFPLVQLPIEPCGEYGHIGKKVADPGHALRSRDHYVDLTTSRAAEILEARRRLTEIRDR